MIDPARVRNLFLAALEQADLAERNAYLHAECADDAELLRRVQALLQAHEQSGGWLGSPTPLRFEDQPPDDQLLGQTLDGRYRLQSVIGSGGMGTVYRAEQLQPVQRPVAIKLIKSGWDSKPLLARFEAERQALAIMDHPHIAKIFDAGSTTGRPYFVMEWVPGTTLIQYCDQHRLNIEQRLMLFVQVCQAVQHAHQKGIIHRDLKPANILVEQRDAAAVPKIIDFGLAKAISLTVPLKATTAGLVLGTPLYMAPEQAEPTPRDVDTRADIFALGVILYELLTGTTPLDQQQVQTAAWGEICRRIREETPLKPSVRLQSSALLASIAAQRHAEPVTLTRTIRGDLDWMVMKALAKEREQRYDTANAFALDVLRYLHHEPVTAGPPSFRYRARKFLRRHRGPVLAATIIFLALVVGMVGTSWGMYRALRAEQQARMDADTARRAAETEAEARQQAEAVAEVLEQTFLRLDPFDDQPDLLKQLADKLDSTTTRLETQPHLPTLTQARLQNAIGLAQLGLGYPKKAIERFHHANTIRTAELGPTHPLTLEAQANLGEAYRQANDYTKALQWLEPVGRELESQWGFADRRTLSALNDLALVYQDTNQLERAVQLTRKILQTRKESLGPDDPLTLLSMNNLAGALRRQDNLDEAISLYEETLRLRTIRLGKEHPSTIASMNNLAFAYQKNKQVERAIPIYERMTELQKERLGADHPDTLLGLNNLAGAYLTAKQPERAMPLFAHVSTAREVRLGLEHEDTLIAKYNWATACIAAKQPAPAEAPLRDIIRVRTLRDADSWRLFNTHVILGTVLLTQKKFMEAETHLLRGYEGLVPRKKNMPNGGRTQILRALATLVELYEAWAKPAEATRWKQQLQATVNELMKSPS